MGTAYSKSECPVLLQGALEPELALGPDQPVLFVQTSSPLFGSDLGQVSGGRENRKYSKENDLFPNTSGLLLCEGDLFGG